MLRPHNVVLQYARRYTGVSSLRTHYTSVTRMPWLMKAEPDSRVVKGKDVKFSVDDFEALGTSPWDGVRNHEAKKIMKEKMKVGDEVLFYHSNCKVPGVFALATVAREGYPDHTAFDPSHPYYDVKSDKEKPTWFMVDVKFTKRLEYPPTLAFIKHLASLSDVPKEIDYVGQDGLTAIKAMALVNRGRLSVQPVEDTAYEAIVKLGTEGGWEGLMPQSKKATKTGNGSKQPQGSDTGSKAKVEKGKATAVRGKKQEVKAEEQEDDIKAEPWHNPSNTAAQPTRTSSRPKRKAAVVDPSEVELSDPPVAKPKRERKKR